MTTIVVHKLNDGTEIIGKVLLDDLFQVTHPKVVQLMRDEEGQIQVGMVNVFLSSPDLKVLNLNPATVICSTTQIPKEVEDGYLGQVSGIQIATSLK
jgi:hypothetical protein